MGSVARERELAHQNLALDLKVHNRKKSAINPSLIQWVRSFVREKPSKAIVGFVCYWSEAYQLPSLRAFRDVNFCMRWGGGSLVNRVRQGLSYSGLEELDVDDWVT
jgi:hypothetical protein